MKILSPEEQMKMAQGEVSLRREIAHYPQLDIEVQRVLVIDTDTDVRLRLATNENIDPEIKEALQNDSNENVRHNANVK